MTNLLIKRVKEAQPQLSHQFERVMKNNQLTHAYLIEHLDISTSYDFALWLSQSVFCLDKDKGQPCGICDNCRRIESFDFPDVNAIEPDGQRIKVEQVREIKQTFIRSGMESRKKVLIIKEAEKMTTSAANSLLKFIEEPDGLMYIFFLTTNTNRILPTIQSRCQQIYLKPVAKQGIELALSQTEELSNSQIKLLVELTDSIEKAVELSQDEWFNSSKETVSKWFQYLENNNPLSFVYVQQYLVKIGKEKEQQFLILDILLVFYRLKLKDEVANQGMKQRQLTNRIEKVISARSKLEANVSFQNVCEQLVWQLLN